MCQSQKQWYCKRTRKSEPQIRPHEIPRLGLGAEPRPQQGCDVHTPGRSGGTRARAGGRRLSSWAWRCPWGAESRFRDQMERRPGDGQLFQGPRRRDEREPQTAAGGQVRGRRGRREGGRRQVGGEGGGAAPTRPDGLRRGRSFAEGRRAQDSVTSFTHCVVVSHSFLGPQLPLQRSKFLEFIN